MFKSISFLLILSLLLCSTMTAIEANVPVIQQQARLDAELDVARDAKTVQWGLGGVFCGFFALGASVAHTPTVPTANLMGKSPEYIVSYTEAYNTAMKRKNITAAGTGCLVNVSVWTVVFLLVFR